MSETLRVRLELSYDGTDFHGWARQPGLRTVQGELETALATVLRRAVDRVELTVAGRTDAGVHARGQVAHLDVPLDAWRSLPGRSDRDPAEALLSRLGGVLARAASTGQESAGRRRRGTSDIVVRAAGEAPAGFDARFSALRRRYTYRVVDEAAFRDPLRRRDVLWHRVRLDVAAMDRAAGLLVGEHDFAAFCKPREGATTIRELQLMTWRRSDGTGGEPAGMLACDVRADAFCHSMVRALVGACLAVGEGRRETTWPLRVLEAGRRDSGVGVAPAHGLTLEEVVYPGEEALAARAAATRRRRDDPDDPDEPDDRDRPEGPDDPVERAAPHDAAHTGPF